MSISYYRLYRHLSYVKLSRFSSFLIALDSMYKTFNPVNSSKFSIFLNPLKCKYKLSFSEGVV